MTVPVNRRNIRVLIADGETLLRSGLSRVLDETLGIEVVAQAANGAEVLDLIPGASPDLAIVDIKLPGLGGIETTRRIVQEFPGVQVVVLTNGHTDSTVVAAMRAGARGYMLKSSSADAVAAGVRAVTAGQYVLAGAVADRVP